jgi:hypothetical protein
VSLVEGSRSCTPDKEFVLGQGFVSPTFFFDLTESCDAQRAKVTPPKDLSAGHALLSLSFTTHYK